MQSDFRYGLLLVVVLSQGCSSDADVAPKAPVLLKGQIQALEKAKSVEKTLQFGAERRHQTIQREAH